MRAIQLTGAGGPEVLEEAEVPTPEPAPGEALVEVVAAGVNRADLLQRQGNYPPPPGASELPGLEVSGRIVQINAGPKDEAVEQTSQAAQHWQVGDEVCALLTGGGYAQYVAVPLGQLLPIPAGVELRDAAALPEVACTVWSNLWQTAHLSRGEVVLLHGGGSGIGTFATQLAAARGATVAVTAGSQAKLERCAELGAEILINYREDDFVTALAEQTDGHGADVILDVVGAKYLDRNVRALAADGRLVVIGLQGGIRGELNLARLLGKRGTIHAMSLRSRPVEQKSRIVDEVRAEVWPLLASGAVRPIIDTRFPLADAAAAHEYLDSGSHLGKVLLDVS